MPAAVETLESLEEKLRMRLEARRAAETLGILAAPSVATVSARRRTGVAPIAERELWLALVHEGGVWRLREEAVHASTSGGARRARRRRRAGLAGELDDLKVLPLARLPHDQVRGALVALDAKLTPTRGLRELDLASATLGAPGARVPVRAERLLVLVHGTFSEGQSLVDGLRRSPDEGRALLAAWRARYDAVYVFDHPTLTVDPVVNAHELAHALAHCSATVDLVAHSRGGLVARWWAEALDKGSARAGRIVFVGSPLAGTGLAAAPNLRKTLDLLANLSAGLGWAAAGVPFLQAALGLFQAFSSAVRVAARAPVPDVLIGLVPGLRAMSRVGNNAELLALRQRSGPVAERFFVRSNFESERAGWRFWKLFRQPLQRAKDAGADAIFDGQNDLVVDTGSMSDWTGEKVPKAQLCDFKTSSLVHHTNYFEQRETGAFLARVLA